MIVHTPWNEVARGRDETTKSEKRADLPDQRTRIETFTHRLPEMRLVWNNDPNGSESNRRQVDATV